MGDTGMKLFDLFYYAYIGAKTENRVDADQEEVLMIWRSLPDEVRCADLADVIITRLPFTE